MLNTNVDPNLRNQLLNKNKPVIFFVRLLVIISMLLASLSFPTKVKAAPVTIILATPNTSGVSRTSQIQITFSEAVIPATFSGSINNHAFVPTQVVFNGANTMVTIDPGELEYARTYSILIGGTVTNVGSEAMGTDFAFSFTVETNPSLKNARTTLNLPTGPFQSGQTYTINGQASGFVWERDANNPLELRHWTVDGTDAGDSPMLHPTVLYFPTAVDGYNFYLYYTPYPPATDENPVLMRSVDGVTFTDATSTGTLQNPLFTYNFQPPYDTQNLADPEVYKVGNTWMLFYEQESSDVLDFMGSGGNIGVALSTDGINWEPYGGAYSYDPLNPPTDFPANGNPVVKPPLPVSPSYRSGEMAVIFKDGTYHMWRTVINGGLFIYHDTATDPRGPWTLQSDVLNLGTYSYGPHPDIVYDAERNLYLMLYLIPNGTNIGQVGLYTSSSITGPWTLHPINPIFSAQSPWEGDRLYRSALVQVNGQWYMYYSGNSTGSPQIGLAREVPGVRRVEISTNGGTSWQQTPLNADGTWYYNWTPSSAGNFTIMARVTDDFMLGNPTDGQSVVVGGASLPIPSSPILLVTNSNYSGNPYNEYLAEILRSEGLVAFQQVELSSLVADAAPLVYLSHYDLVLLAETSLTPAEEGMWRSYVSAGGNLIAMRPDNGLADLFGLTFVSARTEQLLQFLKYDTTTIPGTGIVDVSLQYHGQADNYTLTGATSLASLWDGINTPSTTPAVVMNTYGSGLAAAYTFDLAKSIVLTRQGNPAWKDSEGDGAGGYRPADMFFRTNGDKYLAPERTRIPQADEQQRFLANLIIQMTNTPLPRMWTRQLEYSSARADQRRTVPCSLGIRYPAFRYNR